MCIKDSDQSATGRIAVTAPMRLAVAEVGVEQNIAAVGRRGDGHGQEEGLNPPRKTGSHAFFAYKCATATASAILPARAARNPP